MTLIGTLAGMTTTTTATPPTRLSISDLTDNTPPTRNRVVDFLRALAITVVIVGHWLMAAVVIRDGDVTPNPASYYTLELLPVLHEQFHDWHRRMGLPRSPLDHIACC